MDYNLYSIIGLVCKCGNKKGEHISGPFTEFDDTLDINNYRRVDKLFDSLFRIYELKNNYQRRYGKHNYN